jgi:hypothetical protein
MNSPVVSHSLFLEDDHAESVKTRIPVIENQLEKTVHDARVPGPSISESMVTGVSSDSGPSMQSTSILTTVPLQPPPKEDEAPDASIRNSNPESAFESINLIACNDAKMLNNQANIADVEVKDLNSQIVLNM